MIDDLSIEEYGSMALEDAEIERFFEKSEYGDSRNYHILLGY